MLGRTHALTGWCAGLLLAPHLGAHTLPQAVVVATVTAGSALIPDLDHPASRASRFVAPVTQVLSAVLQAASAVTYRLTKGRRDEYRTGPYGGGEHRHLTHTLVFAAAVGFAVHLACAAWGRWAVLAALLVALMLAVDAMGDWLLPVAVAALVLGLAKGGDLEGIAGWLGLAVGAGCLVHDVGDALTESGCPILWPIPIAGETWAELRPPRLLRFRTGGGVELGLVWPVCAVAAVLLLPGVWPLLAVTVFG
jgi:membrane-bound metal-dependent hydrolase YbcI (DUF457 family)